MVISAEFGVEPRHGLHETRLALRGLDEPGPLSLKCSAVKEKMVNDTANTETVVCNGRPSITKAHRLGQAALYSAAK